MGKHAQGLGKSPKNVVQLKLKSLLFMFPRIVGLEPYMYYSSFNFNKTVIYSVTNTQGQSQEVSQR